MHLHRGQRRRASEFATCSTAPPSTSKTDSSRVASVGEATPLQQMVTAWSGPDRRRLLTRSTPIRSGAVHRCVDRTALPILASSTWRFPGGRSPPPRPAHLRSCCRGNVELKSTTRCNFRPAIANHNHARDENYAQPTARHDPRRTGSGQCSRRTTISTIARRCSPRRIRDLAPNRVGF